MQDLFTDPDVNLDVYSATLKCKFFFILVLA